MKTRLTLAVACVASLSACTSFEPLRPDLAARSVPSRLDEIAYINSLREAFVFTERGDTGCYNGEGLNHFRGTLEQGYPDHTKEQESDPNGRCVNFRDLAADERDAAITEYLHAGFGLTDLYCQRYFVIAAESDKKRQFERNSGATVDALMNAVLGLASAGETALGVANATFEAYDSTYQNIQDAFMVSPDLANVRKLVHAAQLDFKERALADKPGSYQQARSEIERYAGICSYTGMKQLVNDSVTSQTADLLDAADQSNETSDADTSGGNTAAGEQAAEPPADASTQAPITTAVPSARVPRS